MRAVFINLLSHFDPTEVAYSTRIARSVK